MSLIKKIAAWNPLRRFVRSERGLAAVEFALTLPIWTTMVLGCTDGAYCMLVNQRVDRIAYTVTDIVTQYQTMTKAELGNITLAAGQLMQPFTFGNNGVVIVTSVYKPAGQNPTICWQYTGGGGLARASKIGTVGGTPNLPNGLTLNDNDNVIISEAYYVYTPMFINGGLFKGGDVYRVAVYKPRLSQLTTPPT